MPRLDYQPYPTVGALERPPNDYQNIPTRPAQFGAAVGQGLEQLGAGATHASKFYGQIAADQATNNWEDETNKILRGDPNKVGPDGNPDTGYLGLRGQAAMDAWPGVRDQLMQARQKARSGLMTLESTSTFDAQTRRLHFMTLQEGGAHYDREQSTWATEVNKARLQNALLGVAAHPDDDAAVDAYTTAAMDAMLKQLQVTGGDKNPELRNHTMSLARAHVIEARVDAWAPTNPDRAKQYLEANKDTLPGATYDKLNAKVTGHADTVAINGAVSQAMGSVGGEVPAGGSMGGGQNNPGNIRVPGSTGTSKAAFQSFATPEEGVGAIRDLFLRYQDQHGLNTVRGIVSRYSPPSENPTDALVQRAAQTVGVGPDERIDLHDPATMQKMISATIRNEGTSVAPDIVQKVSRAPGEIKVADASGRQGFAQAAGATLDQRLGSIDKQVAAGQLRPELAERAKAQVESRWRAQVIDTERVRTLEEKERKERVQARESEIIADITSNNPKITAQQIGADKTLALSPDAQIRMISFLNAQTKPDPMARVSQETTIGLLSDMRREAGDPRRIDSMEPLYDAFSEGKLSKADFNFLKEQVTTIRDPQGEKLADSTKKFVAGVKSLITRSNPLMGPGDALGDSNLYMFEWTIDQKVKEYRKEGKNPFDLFNPKKPDYLGSPEAIRPFQGTFQQSLEAKTGSLSGPPTAPSYPGAPAKPAVVPRQPGESIPDYLRRTGAAIPGISTPEVAPPAAAAPLPAAPPPAAPSVTPSVPIR